jgi:hypothetical protein
MARGFQDSNRLAHRRHRQLDTIGRPGQRFDVVWYFITIGPITATPLA